MAAPTDEDLVARVLEGEPAAFRALLERHQDACARFAFRMLGQREDAEDVVQDTFLRAYRALGAYDERHLFRAWLFRILVNRCRSRARSRSLRERWLRQLDRDGAPATTSHSERDTDLRDELQRALDRVEPLLREAFLLRYGEDLGYVEIAALTGASVSALKMRVKRARDTMRPFLEATRHE